MIIKSRRLTLQEILLIVLFVTMIITNLSFSKYQSTFASGSEVRIANPILNIKDQTLNDEIELKATNFDCISDSLEYIFSVSNSENENISKVVMEYNLSISNENLPLSYKLYSYNVETKTKGEEISLIESNIENNTENNNKNTIQYVTDAFQMPINTAKTDTYLLEINWQTEDEYIEYLKSQNENITDVELEEKIKETPYNSYKYGNLEDTIKISLKGNQVD